MVPIAGNDYLNSGSDLMGVLVWDDATRQRFGYNVEATASPAFVAPESLDPDTFVTTSQLAVDATRLSAALPPDVDAVVALPRSGLIPAGIVAAARHLPMYQVRDGEVIASGGGWRISDLPVSTPRHVAVIDDTGANGLAMRAALPIILAAWPAATVTRAAVYSTRKASAWLDLVVGNLEGPHYLEWNWVNSGHAERCAFDFDGILCRDFTREECETTATYREAMAAMRPLFLPRRRPVPLIVTARPESCRDLTEDWLRRHGVRWDRLEMWSGEPHPPGATVAAWKATHFAAANLPMFAESDPAQAQMIADVSGRPVLCPAAGRLIRPAPARPDHAASPAEANGTGRRDDGQGYLARLALIEACPHRGPVVCACSGEVQCHAGKGPRWRPAVARPTDCHSCVANHA
jgi:hypothetical protein